MVADHHALARRQVLGEAHGERQPRGTQKQARQGARGRAPLRQARQHDQQGERDQADGHKRSRSTTGAYSTRSGTRTNARDMTGSFTKSLWLMSGNACADVNWFSLC